MVKTLKITTWLSVLAAVCSVAAVAYYSLKSDDDYKEILTRQGVVEEFLKTSQVSANKEDTLKDSPLVKQAEQFALRLDPPPPPPPPAPVINTTPQPTAAPPPPPPPSASFSLTGTVVAATDANMSIALLDTVAKGKRWYRIGEKIGRHEIAEIHKGYIVINDGTTTYEMKAPPITKTTILKGQAQSTVAPAPTTVANNTDNAILPVAAQAQEVVYQPAQEQVQTEMTAEQVQENIDFITQLMNNPEAMGLSKEEAANLGDMSEFVEELKKDMTAQTKKQIPPSSTQKAAAEKADAPSPIDPNAAKPPRYKPRGSARIRK